MGLEDAERNEMNTRQFLAQMQQQVDAAIHEEATALMHDEGFLKKLNSKRLLSFLDAHDPASYSINKNSDNNYRSWNSNFLEGVLGLDGLNSGQKLIYMKAIQGYLNEELELNLIKDGKCGLKTLVAIKMLYKKLAGEDPETTNKPPLTVQENTPKRSFIGNITKKFKDAMDVAARSSKVPIKKEDSPRKIPKVTELKESIDKSGFIKIEHPKYGKIYAWKNPKFSGNPREIVLCLHGHGDSPNGMINRNGLLRQFRSSRRNALFIIPGALKNKRGMRTWQSRTSKTEDFNEIIDLAASATKTKPRKRITAFVHSGAYVSLLRGLKGEFGNSVKDIVFLCSTRGCESWYKSRLKNWLNKNSKNSLTFVLSNSKGRMPKNVPAFTNTVRKYYPDAEVSNYRSGPLKYTDSKVNYYLAENYSHNRVPKLISRVLRNLSGSKRENLS